MKIKQKTVLMGAVMLLATTALASEPPATIINPVTPGTISYQGRLQTADGINYTNGVYDIEFRIFDADAGGTLLWGAAYKPYVQNGYFSVILGATNVGETPDTNAAYAVEAFWKAMWIDPANTDVVNARRYLEMTVLQDESNEYIGPHGANAQPSFPRQQFLASPYAIQAQYAQSAEYASRSVADFTVGDSLMVSTNLAISGNTAANNLTVSGNTVANNLTVSGDASVHNISLTGAKPFFIKSYSSENHNDSVFSTGYSPNNFTAMVVGFDAGLGDINVSGNRTLWNAMAYKSNDRWYIRCQAPCLGSNDSREADWTVHVLFIRNDFVTDDRGTLWGKDD